MRRCLHGVLALAFVALVAVAPARASVVINEIMYNSSFSPDIEFIELYNTGPAAQNLVDWYLLDNSNAHPHCNLVGTLAVGHYLVVAADTALFTSATASPTCPAATGRLPPTDTARPSSWSIRSWTTPSARTGWPAPTPAALPGW